MFAPLDIRTIITDNIILNLTWVVIMAFYRRSSKPYPGFKLWTYSLLCLAGGYLAVLVRTPSTEGLSILANNLLFTLAIFLRWDGFSCFFRARRLRRIYYYIPLGTAILCAAFYYIYDNINIRVFISSAACTWGLLGASLLLHKIYRIEKNKLVGVTLLLIGFSSLLFIIRSASTLWMSHVHYLEFNVQQVLAFSIQNIVNAAIVILFLFMQNQRAEKEMISSKEALKDTNLKLKTALDELNILHGFMSVCAYCKKVEDDQGRWVSLESFVAKKSALDFSHGVCPNCKHKMADDLGDK